MDRFQTKIMFAVASLIFAASMIVATTFWGNDKNALHTAAQYWMIMGFFAVLGGVGFGQVASMFPGFKPAEQKTSEAK
jgi:hypothetical protein